MHRRNKNILIGMGVVVAVMAVVYGTALARSTAKLHAAYAALERDGRPMVAADLIPPEVPDPQNAALLHRKAALLLKGQSAPKNKHLLEYLADLASAFVRGATEPEERAEFDELMAREVVISALATLEEALQRSTCRFDHDYDNGLYADVLASKAVHPLMRRDTETFASRDLHHLACLWGARACLEAEAGRVSQAWDMVQAQFRFADAQRHEPVLSAHFPRLNTIDHLCRTIRKLCKIAPPDERDYQGIEALLRDQADIAPLVYALDAERLLRGEWLFNLPDNQLHEAQQRFKFRIPTFRPGFVADHAAYLRMMRRYVQLLEGPYFQFESPPHKELGNLADHSSLTRNLAPTLLWLAKEFHCDMVARVHLTRAGLALLRYRELHGTFPESLDALGLEDLRDPFVDQPLHYRAENAGFIVYSVGKDQKDNGGTPKPPRDTSGRRQNKQEYDVFWRVW